jgi:hypothetical protein
MGMKVWFPSMFMQMVTSECQRYYITSHWSISINVAQLCKAHICKHDIFKISPALLVHLSLADCTNREFDSQHLCAKATLLLTTNLAHTSHHIIIISADARATEAGCLPRGTENDEARDQRVLVEDLPGASEEGHDAELPGQAQAHLWPAQNHQL